MAKRISVRSAKNKGKELQYFVCERIAKIFGFEFKQDDDLCPVHSRDASLNGTDIVYRTKELQDSFPYSIECKRTEKVSLYDYIEQAKTNQRENTDWLVVHKKNRTEPVVIMSFDAFERLFEKTQNKENINGK